MRTKSDTFGLKFFERIPIPSELLYSCRSLMHFSFSITAEPCQNNGTCVDGINSYKCNCLNGFKGGNCEENINECQSAPCLNGAQCIDGIANYTCNCSVGYTGNIFIHILKKISLRSYSS